MYVKRNLPSKSHVKIIEKKKNINENAILPDRKWAPKSYSSTDILILLQIKDDTIYLSISNVDLFIL